MLFSTDGLYMEVCKV